MKKINELPSKFYLKKSLSESFHNFEIFLPKSEPPPDLDENYKIFTEISAKDSTKNFEGKS